MNITRMAAALAVSAAAVTCSVLAAAPAQSDETTPSSVVAVAPDQAGQVSPASPASPLTPALYDDSFTKSAQVGNDNLDLDEYDGVQVWTRTQGWTYQNFTFTRVGETPFGFGIYTIKGTHYGRCIQQFGVGNPVQLRACDPNNSAQRWIIDTSANWRYTYIESATYPFPLLKGNGADQQVTASYYDGTRDQWWRLYNK
jgi:hypothetical protein